MRTCGHNTAQYRCDTCVEDVRRQLPRFPLQLMRGAVGPVAIPWPVAERAWAVYAQLHGTSQSVERLAERGGFNWGEMDLYLPGWRELARRPPVPQPPAARGTGLFIVVEGGDGAGKSELLRGLAQALKADGHQVVLTAEPSTGPTGQQLRALLADPEAAQATSPAEWALLFAADRLHHLRTVVRPALAAGFLVLSSRYTLSSLAYQGPALGMEWVEVVNAHAQAPDLLLFVDTPPEVGLARLAGQREADAFETLERARAAAAGYAQALARVEASGGTVHRLDGTLIVEELVERARALVPRLPLLRKGKGAGLGEMLEPTCDHDVQPVPGDEDWGRCVRCREEGFPLTERSAYGDVKCRTCKDTGLVPCLFEKPGQLFGDRACPAEGCQAGRDAT